MKIAKITKEERKNRRLAFFGKLTRIGGLGWFVLLVVLILVVLILHQCGLEPKAYGIEDAITSLRVIKEKQAEPGWFIPKDHLSWTEEADLNGNETTTTFEYEANPFTLKTSETTSDTASVTTYSFDGTTYSKIVDNQPAITVDENEINSVIENGYSKYDGYDNQVELQAEIDWLIKLKAGIGTIQGAAYSGDNAGNVSIQMAGDLDLSNQSNKTKGFVLKYSNYELVEYGKSSSNYKISFSIGQK